MRVLGAGDEAAVETFLAAAGRAETSMFLRSNLRRAGIVDRGQTFGGTYVGAFDGGALAGVAACFWNGMVVMQVGEGADLGALVRAAVEHSGRSVEGLSGPYAQVLATRAALGLEAAETRLASREILFALRLAELAVPAAIASGQLVARRPSDHDLDQCAAWRVEYLIEALGAERDQTIAATAMAQVKASQASSWLLWDGGHAVAFSAFNARLPEVVQIGGVWTPVALRGRGYARAVVAASLLEARREGVDKAILFTGEDNGAAVKAYESIGFRAIGEYGIVLLRRPYTVSGQKR